MNAKVKRNVNYDLIRTIAILLVVFCHSIENIYFKFDYFSLSTKSQLFKIISFTISRLGVPLFLLLTGALILKKDFKKENSILNFYKNNLVPLILTYEIWAIIYSIYLYFETNTFNLKDLILEMLFVKKPPISSIWYMPMIIGVYIFLPYLAIVLQKLSLKIVKIPYIITMIAFSFLPTMNIILLLNGLETYSLIIDFNLSGGLYCIYIISGYYIANKNCLKKVNTKTLIVLFIIFFGLTVYVQSLSNERLLYSVWYDSFTLILAGIILFELLNRIKIKRNIIITITNYISKIRLGIYYLHIILVTIIGNKIIRLNFNNPVKVMIIFTLSIISSTLIILVLSKCKLIKKRIFLIKQ